MSGLRFLTIAGVVAGAVVYASGAHAETTALPFYENFEPAWGFSVEWHAFDYPGNRTSTCPFPYTTTPRQSWCPDDPSNAKHVPNPAPNDSWTWGPYKYETWPDKENGGRVYSGARSGRQPVADPYWYAIYHVFDMPATGDLRLKTVFWDDAGILCDCDQQAQPAGYTCDCNNLPPPNASRPNFDVNAGIELGSPNRRASYAGNDKDYFFLGINSHHSWDHYAWATTADGWVVSNIARTHGWHVLEIVVHPYTGGLDAEFRIDGVLAAQGHRMPGPSGAGVTLTYLHLGGDPALITESNLSNTFEDGWYDEVALTNCHDPRPDSDGDGEVNMNDFAALQRCFTGAADPFVQVNPLFDRAGCQCFDLDGDQDVDDSDLTGFLACASGPGVLAAPECDH